MDITKAYTCISLIALSAFAIIFSCFYAGIADMVDPDITVAVLVCLGLIGIGCGFIAGVKYIASVVRSSCGAKK